VLCEYAGDEAAGEYGMDEAVLCLCTGGRGLAAPMKSSASCRKARPGCGGG
jgi:hypothetical protein